MSKLFYLSILCLFLTGCQSTQLAISEEETPEDLKQAIGSVAEALSGEELSEEEVGELTNQIQNDPEAQAAIKSISDSFSEEVRVKYNPQTGERFAPHLTHDPVTGVELKELD